VATAVTDREVERLDRFGRDWRMLIVALISTSPN
jgi:hypothetical protein